MPWFGGLSSLELLRGWNWPQICPIHDAMRGCHRKNVTLLPPRKLPAESRGCPRNVSCIFAELQLGCSSWHHSNFCQVASGCKLQIYLRSKQHVEKNLVEMPYFDGLGTNHGTKAMQT